MDSNFSSRKREILAKYDAIAEVYDELYGEEQAYKHNLVVEGGYVEGKRVLDCGCGTGGFLKYIVSKVQLAVGVDVSLKMLEVAKKRGEGEIRLLLADFDNLPFRDDAFDVIVSFTSLSPYLNLESIRGWLRLVKPPGKIILSILKKTVTRNELLRFLEGHGLRAAEFIDEDFIKDYLIVLERI